MRIKEEDVLIGESYLDCYNGYALEISGWLSSDIRLVVESVYSPNPTRTVVKYVSYIAMSGRQLDPEPAAAKSLGMDRFLKNVLKLPTDNYLKIAHLSIIFAQLNHGVDFEILTFFI